MKIIYILLFFSIPIFAMAPMPTHPFTKQELSGCEEFVQHLFSEQQVTKKLQRACLNPLKTKEDQQIYLMANIQSRRLLSNWPKFSLNAFEDKVLALKLPKKKNELILKDLHAVFDKFLSYFSNDIKFNFLIKEKYTHIPYDFKLKPFSSPAELLNNLSSAHQEIEMVPGFKLFCLLPAQRAREFLTQAQVVFKPGKTAPSDIRKVQFSQGRLNFTLPAWRIVHGLGFFKNEEQESIYPEGKPELEEIISFATSSLDHLREYLFFAHFSSSSTAEPGHYIRYNQTVRKLRKNIFTYWLSDELKAQECMAIHAKFAGPFYAKLDAWLFGVIRLNKLLREDCPGTKKTFLAYVYSLKKKHAPYWMGSSEEFLVSPYFELAVKNQQQNQGFYTKMKKNLMEKAGIAKVEPCHPRYLFSSYADQSAYLKENFPRIDNLLSESLDPFEQEEWESFISGKARSMFIISNLIDHKLRDKFPSDSALQYLRKGYLHYKELPWAAWCFLHGRPFQMDSISWQEMAQVLFEHYSKAGRLLDFLRYFKAKVEPNLRTDIFAERTRAVRAQIISFHRENGPEEFRQAAQEQLIEPEFLQVFELEVGQEQPQSPTIQAVENEPSIELAEIVLPEPMTEKREAPHLDEPIDVEEVLVTESVPEPLPLPLTVDLIEPEKELPQQAIAEPQEHLAHETLPEKPAKKKKRKRRPQRSQRKIHVDITPQAPINPWIIPAADIEECLKQDSLEYSGVENQKAPACLAELYGIKPGDSDRLWCVYNHLVATSLTDPDWDSYFQELFDYFVDKEDLQFFLKEHVNCKEINQHYLSLYGDCQFYLNHAVRPLQELKTLWPDGYRNEGLHLQSIWQTLAQYDRAPNPSFLENFCLKLCQEQIALMRKIEDNAALSEACYKRYEENKLLIREHFTYLKTWVIGQKCNLIKNADYCQEVLPSLQRHYETLLSAVKYCQQIR